MEKQEINTISENQIHRLIAFANFLSGIKMDYPLDENSKFKITKKNSGFDIDSDNLTFLWVIGLLPLVFGKYWAFSSNERIILKEDPNLSTFNAVQRFFGLSMTEYFMCFVAYFQEQELTVVPHDSLTGVDIAANLRELAKRKMIKKNSDYERI